MRAPTRLATDRHVGRDVCWFDSVCIFHGGSVELAVRRDRSLIGLREREQVQAILGGVVLNDFADIVDRQEQILL